MEIGDISLECYNKAISLQINLFSNMAKFSRSSKQTWKCNTRVPPVPVAKGAAFSGPEEDNLASYIQFFLKTPYSLEISIPLDYLLEISGIFGGMMLISRIFNFRLFRKSSLKICSTICPEVRGTPAE